VGRNFGRAALFAAAAAVAVATGVLAASITASAAAPEAGPTVAHHAGSAERPVARPNARPVARSGAERPGPCSGNRYAKLIKVSIAGQRAWFCEHRHQVRVVPVTTGASALAGRATPQGRFRIEGRARNTVLRPSDGGQFHVRYWVPFSGTDYGFHDASWQRFPLGSPRYRWRGSHGCVHMSVPAMRFLYRWASTGTRVSVR
jgi:lipoprotein-anchoring transpeptidase ErfK/SrfK